MMEKDWRLGLLAAYALVLIGVVSQTWDPGDSSTIPVLIVYLLVTCAPIAALCLWRGQALVKGLGAAVIGGLGLLLLIYVMFVAEPDAQGALVFLIVPVLQIAATGVFALAVFIGVRVMGKGK